MTTTEKHIENDLIEKLQTVKYAYRADIRDRDALEKNFRAKFEALNCVKLTDGEFQRILEKIINPDVFSAAKMLRAVTDFERDDGTPLNFTLVNIKDWCKNSFEVIHQLRMNTKISHHRYDVILLINGVPVVQIELKSIGISPRRAMQQIVEYKNDPGNGYGKTLLCFLQIFVVSNQQDTWYFANNNEKHFSFNVDERFLPIYQMARENNEKISRLDIFAETFLAKCLLGQMISSYTVLIETEQKLLLMRPYQIYAVKAIVACIHQNCGNGYIWHTTGSGKTLTSFKASTLLKDNPDVDKCLFVVDRKDLDRQTRDEFNRFQKGCVEENTNTEALVQRLLSDDYADKVIVTTIQKLGLALNSNSRKNYKERLQELQDRRMVFIFDECHRSQFGENHDAIKDFFPNAQLFGFTGTPIFEDNAIYQQRDDDKGSYRTTNDLFQNCLHEYTITHAIDDLNVLKFHIDYFKPEGSKPPKPGEAVAKGKVIETILAKHDGATAQRKFNALLATASINDAIEYVENLETLQRQRLSEDPNFTPLNIACVFSPPATVSSDVKQLQEDLPTEQQNNLVEPAKKKAALQAIIDTYNTRYETHHSLNEFDLYYQDVQTRIKNQQYSNADVPRNQKIDITIVVDMLLTGFDSKYLNTLYVDKNLKHHGLIQAFSRTNRVLNDSKPYGNILDFRQQELAVNEAIALFSGEKSDQAKEVWLVDPAPAVINRFETSMKELEKFMASQGLSCAPEAVANLRGDAAKGKFIELFKKVQRLKTQLDQYTDLSAPQKEQVDTILPKDNLQGFKGMYLETARRLQDTQSREGDKAPPVVQELDFEFVLFASAVVDYDYIMSLIARMSGEKPAAQKLDREQLIGLIEADAKFIDEREAISAYIRGLPLNEPLKEKDIRAGYEHFKAERDAQELKTLAGRHGVALDAVQPFVTEVLRRRVFDGDKLSDMLAPLDLGWKARTEKELALMSDLAPYLRRLAKGREISGLDVYDQ